MHGSGSRAAPGARTGAHYGASSDGRDWREPRSRQSRQRAHFGYPRHRLRVCTAPRLFTECLGACECSPRRPPTTPHRYYQLQAPGPGLWSLSLASGAELQSAAVPGSRYAVPSARALSARHGAATGARHGAAVPGSRYAVPVARALAVPLLSYTGTTFVDVFVGACKCSPRRPPTPPGATLDIFVGADPNQGLSSRAAAAPALAAAPAAPAAGTARDDTVHIFSPASGLLYERFLRIMMKTAVERASRPLKFWILGNFLSPAFRHAVNSGALATAVGAQVIASLIRWRSCSTTGHLIAYVFVCDDCV